MRYLLGVALLLTLSLALLGPSSSSPAAAETVAVAIRNFAFSPAIITVPAGTTVTWTNEDQAPHTATSTAAVWDSGVLNTGGSFSFSFDTPGSFSYLCAIHPSMRGTVVVAAAAPAPPLAMSAPTLTGPADGAALTSFGPTLTWANPAETTQYHLQVIPVNNDGPGVDVHIGTAEASFQVPPPPQWYGLLPDMSYTWRVRVSGAGSFVGLDDASWSGWAERRFRTPVVSSATVSAVAPASGAQVASLTPTLQWANSRSDVFYYEVQLSKAPDFGPTAFLYQEFRHGGVTDPPNSYTVPAAFPLEAGATYFWRVRPRVQGDGTPVAWPQPFSFKTPSAAGPTPTPRPIETACIDYSDGTYEGTSANEQGQALAVLFTLPSPGRWHVTHLRYHIVRNPVPFDAAIFSRQQAELARQRVEPTAAGLVEVNISAQNVVVDGDFYGALVYLQGSAGNAATFGPRIGRDSSMPDGRSWVTKPGGVWKTWQQEDIDQRLGLGDGDFAIIACVRGPL